VLGEREGGAARLEESVAAYREALQEHARARVLERKWTLYPDLTGRQKRC
jgi:hypothetical protein